MPSGKLAHTPAGVRIYAIGDVHGCLDKLESLAWQIADDAKDATGHVRVVLVGDYVDRGQQSRETIDYLIATQRKWNWTPLKGNHDCFLPFSSPPDGGVAHWCQFGGRETLMSYGIDVSSKKHEEIEGMSDAIVSEFRRVAP